jgi:hypothetical protein
MLIRWTQETLFFGRGSTPSAVGFSRIRALNRILAKYAEGFAAGNSCPRLPYGRITRHMATYRYRLFRTPMWTASRGTIDLGPCPPG